MKAFRVVLLLMFIALVVLQGVSGFVTGAALVVVAELVAMRWRLAGTAATHWPAEAKGRLQTGRQALGQALRRIVHPKEVPGEEDSGPFPGLNRVYHFSSLRGFDLTLRPRLAAAATVRLADRHGVDIELQKDRAKHLLGVEVWTLLDPARPTSADKHATPVDRDQIDQLVTAIENL